MALDDEFQDKKLAQRVAVEIETTCEALHREVNQNHADQASELSAALRDQAAAYQYLREIEISED